MVLILIATSQFVIQHLPVLKLVTNEDKGTTRDDESNGVTNEDEGTTRDDESDGKLNVFAIIYVYFYLLISLKRLSFRTT